MLAGEMNMPDKRQSPVHIPLSFLDAVRGLGKVDPKQLTPRPGTKGAKKKSVKPRAKKKG
jgi:hypothetical protein